MQDLVGIEHDGQQSDGQNHPLLLVHLSLLEWIVVEGHDPVTGEQGQFLPFIERISWTELDRNLFESIRPSN